MSFVSVNFLFFFLVFFIIYWSCEAKYKKYIILLANILFYLGSGISYTILLFAIVLFAYIGGVLIEKEVRYKRIVLLVSICSIIGCLVYFKYHGLLWGKSINIVMPLGISFYTFKVVSYLADVYKGMPAERKLINFAIYVSFFIDIASGPIDRYRVLMPQINKTCFFDYDKVSYGLKLIAWGLFKKMVVSDTMVFYTEWIYGEIHSYSGMTLLLTSFFYTIQIYCDFSAYTDIAIGLGKMLGLDLMLNFRSPYFSTSIKEFWSRWHISLSTWFRDYVYIPLGGNRCGTVRRNINLLCTFLISGIWHGASWNFVLWGGVHGLAQVFEHIIGKRIQINNRVVIVCKGILVFLFCNFTWVLFRLTQWNDIIYFFTHFLKGLSNPIMYVMQAQQDFHMDKFLLGKIIFMIGFVAVFDFANRKQDVIKWIGNRRLIVRWTIYSAFALLCYAFLPVEQGKEFLYFQF